jgi:predicted transcriptional regulator
MTDAKTPSSRHAVLDLAPLELDCMNMLWPMGEGTVRPRAYTTIMTIMDRLARKGVVERRKTGRAYTYRPNLSAENARAQALSQVIDSFFGGSRESLMAHLNGTQPKPRALAAAIAGGNVNAVSPATSSTPVASASPAATPPTGGDSVT